MGKEIDDAMKFLAGYAAGLGSSEPERDIASFSHMTGSSSTIYSIADSIASGAGTSKSATTARVARESVAVTAEELGEETRLSRARSDSTDSTDPTGWKMTSVRWLRENYPKYVRGRGVAHDILATALKSMKYGVAETSTDDCALDLGAANKFRTAKLSAWGPSTHAEIKSYLAEGGFGPRLTALRGPKGQADITMTVKSEKPEVVGQSLDEVVAELTNPAAGSW